MDQPMKRFRISLLLVAFAILIAGIVLAVTPGSSSTIVVRSEGNFSGQERGYTLLNQDPDPAEPGSYVDVRFKIENTGSQAAENFIFELLPEYPFRLGQDDSAQRRLGTIYARQLGEQAALVYYRLFIDDDAVEGDNLINLRYSTDGGQTWVRPLPAAIRIQSHDAILAIEEVKLDPALANPGGKFKLSFLIVNHAQSLLKNIRITANLGSGDSEQPFSPFGMSNEQVIGSLEGKQSTRITYDFVVDADAISQAYKLPIEIKYSDRSGRNFTKQNVIGILVGQEPEVSLSVQSSEVYSSGRSGAIVLKVINKGTSDVKFFNLKVKEGEGFEVIGTDEVYIGELDSDDFSTAEFKVYVDAQGDSVGIPVTYEFKDSSNNAYTKEATLALPLYSKNEARKIGLEQGSFTTGIVIVIVILLLGYLGYRRWRKRKE